MFEKAESENPGIVDENVELAEGLFGLLDGRQPIRLTRHIEMNVERRLSYCRGRLLTLFVEYIPDSAGENVVSSESDYLEQIEGEVKIRRQNPRGGFVYEWQQVGDNHLFDCEVAQVVAASMAGFIGAESFELNEEEEEKEEAS